MAVGQAEGANCAVGCDAALQPLTRVGVYPLGRCPGCGLMALGPAPAGGAPAEALERDEFEGAFYELRVANYGRILAALAELGVAPPARVLDVGCSSGWFLEQAGRRGYRCSGIEPDEFFFSRARGRLPTEIELVNGFFDRDLPSSWQGFDVITFHDVFEHIPQPLALLDACRRRLTPNGVLVLSLPSAQGFVYQLARGLHSIGWSGPFERVYQVHYPFPHLFYFDDTSVAAMSARAGFELVRRLSLRGFSARGAWHRARMDRAAGMAAAVRGAASAAALVGFAGLQRLLPADNVAYILKPRPA